MVDQYSSLGAVAISDNAAGFSRALMAMTDHIDGNILAVFRKTIIDLYRRLSELTPVDTGRAKASWGLSTTGYSTEAPEGEYSYNEVEGVINGNISEFALTLHDDQVTIYNNLEYMEFLENGSSQQAPHGMVALSLAEFEAFFNAAIKGMEGVSPA